MKRVISTAIAIGISVNVWAAGFNQWGPVWKTQRPSPLNTQKDVNMVYGGEDLNKYKAAESLPALFLNGETSLVV